MPPGVYGVYLFFLLRPTASSLWMQIFAVTLLPFLGSSHAPMISLFSTPAELTLPARANADATHGISHPVHMLATTLSLVPFSFLAFTKSCP